MRKLFKNQDGNIEIITEDFCKVISLAGFESHGPNFATDEDDVDNHDGDYLLCYEDGSFQICTGEWQYGVQTTSVQPGHMFFATEKDGADCTAKEISECDSLCTAYIMWDGHNWILQSLENHEEIPEGFNYELTGHAKDEEAGIIRTPAKGTDGKEYWYVETRHVGYHNCLEPR